MGTPADREAYATLTAWLRERVADLPAEDRDKVESHLLRVLDSKRPATQALVADALAWSTCSTRVRGPTSSAHAGLAALAIPFEIDTRLVRGIDYYIGDTLLEFQSEALETAQSTIIGGGRYDGLAEQLGGPPTPGIGFGSGIERVLLACDGEGVLAAPDSAPTCSWSTPPTARRPAYLVHQLRLAGRCAPTGRSTGGR